MSQVIQTNQLTIPSTQQDLDEINKVLGNVTDSMIRAEAERDYQSEAVKDLSKKHKIPVKMLKQIAKMKAHAKLPFFISGARRA